MRALKVTTDAELRDCLSIRRKVFIEEQNVPEELEMDEFDALGQAVHVLLYDEDGSPVATARFRPYRPGEQRVAKVQRVAVLSDARGRGLGKRVMEAVEALAREEGFSEIVLDAQLHAEPFYLKLGYRRASDDVFEDAGILHVRMQKELG
ncbi:GNAT family N-acetyltransferase [Alicyclobacillus vulcanalis]|uniref:Predicted N-acyltransferase, GNAT family n=1 Tax=Alicyclobacillus vulcanalis TaxID=252246 RepID=A0A1N7M3K3_9BACL|nr:GNAT family N-acetyltransferase [Alicyclobacillus vulcanalis]SIS80623.1 Predicted N-acyltransferase, GNAT family [Alicyclobacillus vulcanalis]